ncbi:hypothetical protein HYU23_04745 [Candidatus Woesearchaeota archaeon]|nr:hypothetical protein [Candidatus Woesearchaeota archaeon]
MKAKNMIVGLVSLLGCQETLPKNDDLHDIWRDLQENIYGRKGASTYLLDKRGWPKSFGYHEITPTSDGFIADFGACEYSLDKKGKLVRIISDISGCETAPAVYGKEEEKLSVYRRKW